METLVPDSKRRGQYDPSKGLDQLLNKRAVAAFLGISYQSVAKLISHGVLTAYDLHYKVRYPEMAVRRKPGIELAEVVAYMKSRSEVSDKVAVSVAMARRILGVDAMHLNVLLHNGELKNLMPETIRIFLTNRIKNDLLGSHDILSARMDRGRMAQRAIELIRYEKKRIELRKIRSHARAEAKKYRERRVYSPPAANSDTAGAEQRVGA